MATIYLNKTPRELLPERHSFDFYATPQQHIVAALDELPIRFHPEYILDAGAGGGAWGWEMRRCFPNAVIVGTDIRPLSRPRCYDFWFSGGYNFLMNDEEGVFDLAAGNPPYGKNGDRKEADVAERFVRRQLALVREYGYVLNLLPLTFLAGLGRGRGFYQTLPPLRVIVCSARPSFTGNGRTDATEYAFYLWQKGYQGQTELTWSSTLLGPIQPALFDLQWHRDETVEPH